MKLFIVKDNMSGQYIDCSLSENLDTYKRQFINAYLSVKEKNNFSAIRLWNDCDVYQLDVDNTICNKVLVLKDFINDFETKKGSNLDKSE